MVVLHVKSNKNKQASVKSLMRVAEAKDVCESKWMYLPAKVGDWRNGKYNVY